MIRIQAFFEGREPVRLKVFGHAGFADAGQDIVCAAVSAVVQTAAIGAKAYDCESFVLQDEKNALIEIGLEGSSSKEALAILKAAYLGLMEIAAQQPCYVKATKHISRRWKA